MLFKSMQEPVLWVIWKLSMEELFFESGFESNLVRAKRIKWNRKKKSRDTGRNKCAILNKKHEENVCPW